MAGCFGIQVPDCRDFPPHLGIRSLEDQNKRDALSRPDIQNPEDRSSRGVPSRLGIHNLEDRDKRGIPNGRGNHSPAARNPDIRKQGTDRRDIRSLGSRTRRPGSRNRCPVAVEV
jgi:hypothetical protein